MVSRFLVVVVGAAALLLPSVVVVSANTNKQQRVRGARSSSSESSVGHEFRVLQAVGGEVQLFEKRRRLHETSEKHQSKEEMRAEARDKVIQGVAQAHGLDDREYSTPEEIVLAASQSGIADACRREGVSEVGVWEVVQIYMAYRDSVRLQVSDGTKKAAKDGDKKGGGKKGGGKKTKNTREAGTREAGNPISSFHGAVDGGVRGIDSVDGGIDGVDGGIGVCAKQSVWRCRR